MAGAKKDHRNKLTGSEVEHIAKLARLGITDEEKEKFGRELSAILEYIEELNRVNTDGVLPMAGPDGVRQAGPYGAGGTELVNVMRPDEPRSIDLISEPSLIEQAPESEKGFVKVPRILE